MPRVPSDINSESGFRLPIPNRDKMNNRDKEIYDKVVGSNSRTIAGVKGPFGIHLYNPELAAIEHTYSEYLRFDTGLNGRIRELAILITAREMNSQFEWAAHEPVALKEGLEPELIDIIKYRKRVTGLKEPAAIMIRLGHEMFSKRKVSSATFAIALRIFGTKKLVNLVCLMSHYAAVAIELRVFDNQISPKQPRLPIL